MYILIFVHTPKTSSILEQREYILNKSYISNYIQKSCTESSNTVIFGTNIRTRFGYIVI